jgi:predicted membrane metal-binding protein
VEVALALVAVLVVALEHVLACVPALVVSALVVLVASVLACVPALVVSALVVLAASVLVAVLVVVPVLARVLVVALVARVLVVAPVVHVLVVAPVAVVLALMVSVVHRERSRARVDVVSSRNCSRSSRHTPHQMLQCLKARSSLNVVHLHKSLHQS